MSSAPVLTSPGGASKGRQEARSPGGVTVPGVVRRRPGWVWGGASLVVASAVGFAAVVAMAGERESVLAVARDLPAGHVIEPRDLREAQVAADSGVVPAGQAASVVGKAVAVPLAAGSLLAPGQVGGDAAYPPPGHSEVSFQVAAGDAPELEQGQNVAVFPGPSGATPVTGAEEGASPVVGTVSAVRESDAPGDPLWVTVLIESVGAERAASLERPRVVVLAPRDGGAR